MTYEAIPDDMKREERWGCWRLERRKNDMTKVPYSALTGREAASTRPNEWTTFERAEKFLERARPPLNGPAFRLGEYWAGVDLDGCRDPETGVIHEWALGIVGQLRSYTEISPSMTGLKIFLIAELPPGRRKTAKVPIKAIEMYDSGRYFTVTGLHLPGTPREFVERTNELASLHHEVFGNEANNSEHKPPPVAPPLVVADDSEIIARMFRAKNGPAVWRLWNGDKGEYGSQSEADLALVSHIAFFVGRDAGRIDRLFRQSRLYREKWEERHGEDTYGAMTISKALSGAVDFYRPGGIRAAFAGPIGID